MFEIGWRQVGVRSLGGSEKIGGEDAATTAGRGGAVAAISIPASVTTRLKILGYREADGALKGHASTEQS